MYMCDSGMIDNQKHIDTDCGLVLNIKQEQ